jgi:hypothetical protein
VTVNRTENIRFSLTILDDGTEVEDLTITGTLMYHMVIPGYGSLANNSGREILQFTWQWDEGEGEGDDGAWILIEEQVFFDTGPNNELSDAEFAIICAQIA